MPDRTNVPTVKQHGVRMVAHFLLASLLVMLVLVPLPPAEAVTQAEIDALRQRQSEISSSKQEIQTQINSIQGDKQKLLEQKSLLERKIEDIRQELQVTNELIALYDQQIADAIVELQKAEADYEEHFERFCERVRHMEERGSLTYLSVLFDASDFSDFLDRVNVISEIMSYDNLIMDALEEARQRVEDKKLELEGLREDQMEVKEWLEASQADLKQQEAAVDALMAEIKAEEAKYQAELEALEDQAADISSDIAAAERQYAAQIAAAQQAASNGSLAGTGGYIWPLPGYTYISSYYGTRTHPVTGARYSFHNGIDLPAPAGTNIIASKSGTVVISTYNSSYGNYVVIAHTDGTKSLYAHMRSRKVSAGEIVTQGEVIGYVGTTGSSTGNHLHFETWTGSTSSTRVDPLNYF